jgi:TonB family protein
MFLLMGPMYSAYQVFERRIFMRLYGFRPVRPLATALCSAAVIGLILTLSLPAHADERAVKTRVAPVYPEIAKRMKITGDVKVEATVDAEGKVTDVKAVSGSKTLSPAAEDAVRKWRFVPGADVSHVDVTVKFEISQ